MLNPTDVKRVIEAALLASQAPLSLADLKRLFDEEIGADTLRRLLGELREEWGARAVELVNLASGWRFQTRAGATGDELAARIGNLLALRGMRLEQIGAVCVSSVVPPLAAQYEQLCRDLAKLRKLGAPSHTAAIVGAVHAAAAGKLGHVQHENAGQR